jgi:hypothetical protein
VADLWAIAGCAVTVLTRTLGDVINPLHHRPEESS